MRRPVLKSNFFAQQARGIARRARAYMDLRVKPESVSETRPIGVKEAEVTSSHRGGSDDKERKDR